METKKLTLVLGIIAVVIGAGCIGKERSLTPSEVVEAFYTAILEGKIKEAMSYCSSDFLKEMEEKTGKEAEEALREIYENAKAAGNPTIEIIREHPPQPYKSTEIVEVEVRSCSNRYGCREENTIAAIKENGVWKITIKELLQSSSGSSIETEKVNTARGLSTIKIMEPSIQYEAGKTTDALSFTLAAGRPITNLQITDITGSCRMVSSNDPLASDLSAGEVDSVQLTDCENKDKGDSFSVMISFRYTSTISNLSHVDTGIIQGFAE